MIYLCIECARALEYKGNYNRTPCNCKLCGRWCFGLEIEE